MYISGISLGEWHTTAQHALGSLGLLVDAQGAKQYKYVKFLNVTTTAVAFPRDMLAYLGSPSTDEEINTVVSDFSDGDTKPVGAGAMAPNENGDLFVDGVEVTSIGSTSVAHYGWIQQTGYIILRQALGGTVAAGDALLCDAAADKALTLATAADDPVCAYGIVDATKNVRLCCV